MTYRLTFFSILLMVCASPVLANSDIIIGQDTSQGVSDTVESAPVAPHWSLLESPTDATDAPLEAVSLRAALYWEGASSLSIEEALTYVELTVTDVANHTVTAGTVSYHQDLLVWRPDTPLAGGWTYNVQYFFANDLLGYAHGNYGYDDILGSFQITTRDSTVSEIGANSELSLDLYERSEDRTECCPHGRLACDSQGDCDQCFQHAVRVVLADASLVLDTQDSALTPYLFYNVSFAELPLGLGFNPVPSSGALPSFPNYFEEDPLPSSVCVYAVVYDALHDQTFELTQCSSTEGLSTDPLTAEEYAQTCNAAEAPPVSQPDVEWDTTSDGTTPHPQDDGNVSKQDCACSSVRAQGSRAPSPLLASLSLLLGACLGGLVLRGQRGSARRRAF